MGLWETFLATASLGGVELPISKRVIRGGRDFARKRLPFVAGQEVEDTGRLPRTIDIDVELFADMDEPGLYPERYEDLVTLLQDDDQQSAVQWNDPVWGPIQVKVVSWQAEEDAQNRDGVRVSIVMEENGFLEAGGQTRTLIQPDDRADAETDAAEFDALIAELAITGGDIEGAWAKAGFKKKPLETTSFADQVDAFLDDLDAGLARADKITASVNVFQARTEAVMRLPAARTALAWPVVDKGTRLINSVVAAGNEVVSRVARVLTITTTGTVSIFELASSLYGDRKRAEEILLSNPLLRPLFIPAGTVLHVLEPDNIPLRGDTGGRV